MSQKQATTTVQPGQFEAENHYYDRVLNAQIHPLVRAFMNLGNNRIIERYCHLHPEIPREAVEYVLRYQTKHMRWAGADLFCVTNDRGTRKVVVIELNSCPSGQKSMPIIQETSEHGSYRVLLERAFLPMLKKRSLPEGELAVLYDKNHMESSGYAATLADLTNQPVYLVRCDDGDPDPAHRFNDGVLEIRDPDGQWQSIRAAIRYVTQKPWNRIPPVTKTLFFNPILICLAGGRNKMLAAKAYEIFNRHMRDQKLQIKTPETIRDVSLDSVRMHVDSMGGIAVVKNPYSNAGQGVYTIVNQEELQAFLDEDHSYDRFIVQSLIGNSGWSSRGSVEPLYHLGTIPDKRNNIYVADLRFMVGVGEEGFFPVAIYARRAARPLEAKVSDSGGSWEILGTNLSYKDDAGKWKTQTERLLLMDSRDFNRLGIGVDDLIESYLQSVLSTIAIDQMAEGLVNSKKKFRHKFFATMNPDPRLVDEVMK
jgi:hypothetical protein